MTHIIALTAIIIGAGLIAKVLPKVIIWVFERFPEHFKPQESSVPTDPKTIEKPVHISKTKVVEALQNSSDYEEPQLVGAGHILIRHRESDKLAQFSR